MAMSILILSGRIDKWRSLRRYRPVITAGIHNADGLSQLAKSSLAKTEQAKSTPAEQ